MRENFRALKNYDAILIDSMNLIIQEYHAKSILSYNGKKTGALFGVLKKILSLRKMYPRAKIVFLWEGYNSPRKQLSPLYKANRNRQESDFFESLSTTRRAISLIGVEEWTHIGAEADDLVSYYLQKFPVEKVLLLTTDHDWFQFVNEAGSVDVMMKGNIYTYNDLQKLIGFPPNKITVYKILTGDESDNIRGIERFPHQLAIRIAIHVSDYTKIRDFPFLETESKWKNTIMESWEQVELNAKIISTHPEWIQERSLIVQLPPKTPKEASSRRMELLSLLSQNGIKSLQI